MNTNSIAALIGSAAEQLHGPSDITRLEAELLLAHTLVVDRSYCYAWPERVVEAAASARFQALVARRSRGEPLAYIIGVREFWSLSLQVTPDTLIPRSDTELLVEHTIARIDCHLRDAGSCKVLDLGTGSGAIAIAIASERPSVEVHAIDNSEAALDVAKSNAANLGATVKFYRSNWFDRVANTDFQMIVSNPPYIDPQDPHLQQADLQHEPRSALVAANNGFADIETIIQGCPAHLSDGGTLLLEHGHRQADGVRDRLTAAGFSNVVTHTDIEQRERITVGSCAVAASRNFSQTAP